MKLWFLKRGYPENIVDQELGKVDFSELSRRTNKKDKGACLVAPYHPLLQNIRGFFIDTLICLNVTETETFTSTSTNQT